MTESEPQKVKSESPLKSDEKLQDSNALVTVEKSPDSVEKVKPKDRDVALAHMEKEKTMSYIKAWEESEKTKVDNKAQKKLSDVSSWENSKKAALESSLKKIEEKLEKQKAEHAERLKNKVALIHKAAEEKRAMIEAQRGEEIFNTEEASAKHRATGQVPKKRFGCF